MGDDERQPGQPPQEPPPVEQYTGTVTIEDASDGDGFYLRVLAENGLKLAHSEIYTGHRPGTEVAQTLVDTLRNPRIVDRRALPGVERGDA